MTPSSTKKFKQSKKSLLRDYIIMGAILVAAAAALLIFPAKASPVLDVSKNYMMELVLILPAVLIIIGLFSVWMPKETVVKYMGKTSGMKGIFLSIGLGMLPTGPLYIAFPMAVALQSKGAKISNIIIFISTWACIKLPQELIEIQFLGIKFTAARLALTLIFIIIMGLLIEKIINFTDEKNIKTDKNS
ncbi:MAG: permease [Actinomycetota bacterium]